MIVYGVDLGLDGAVAVTCNGQLCEVLDLPAVKDGKGAVSRRIDGAAFAALMRDVRARYGVDREAAVVERVAARPGQGVSSVFSLGHTTGAVEGVLLALGVPVVQVTPQQWKRAMQVTSDKDAARSAASRAFPAHAGNWTRKLDHNRAEAALLAAWYWRERA